MPIKQRATVAANGSPVYQRGRLEASTNSQAAQIDGAGRVPSADSG